MRTIPAMQDMQRSPSEKAEAMMPSIVNEPDYPYGLSVCFDNTTLEKLDLDTDDVEVGDFIHIHALAKVTCVSKNQINGESNSRIELIMTHISAEDEDNESDEEEAVEKEPLHKKMYKK
jgi:hypothetical protein